MYTPFPKRSQAIFSLLLLSVVFIFSGCKKGTDPTPIGDGEIKLSLPTRPDLSFDQITAEVNTDAETSPFVRATITASQSSGDATLSLVLHDTDSIADPFRPGGEFSINAGTSTIYASLSFTDQNGTSTAISGLISLRVYECLPKDSNGDPDLFQLSGDIVASDGVIEYIGVLSDIVIGCVECEGGC
ncbi:MAG: hypothetical protein AAF206_11225 [Bacteroidota bacterium]